VKVPPTISAVLVILVLTAGAARAHVDSFGTPDPYWQNLASGSSRGPGGPAADATTTVAGAAHPRALQAYLYVMAALLVAFAARGVRHLLREFVADAGGAGIRTVEVRPPSARREAGFVLAAATAIAGGALLMIAPGSGAGTGPRASGLLPFQVRFRDAPPVVQRMYREMQEGLLETERRRAATKAWPAVSTLAAEGIPPFTLARPPYRWTLVRDDVFVDYIGLPDAGGPAFLLLVQEPDPNIADASPADELHHRLADGTLLHVSIWFRDGAPAVPAGRPVTQPAAAGWTQVVVGERSP
jgi:hypothetical protein